MLPIRARAVIAVMDGAQGAADVADMRFVEDSAVGRLGRIELQGHDSPLFQLGGKSLRRRSPLACSRPFARNRWSFWSARQRVFAPAGEPTRAIVHEGSPLSCDLKREGEALPRPASGSPPHQTASARSRRGAPFLDRASKRK